MLDELRPFLKAMPHNTRAMLELISGAINAYSLNWDGAKVDLKQAMEAASKAARHLQNMDVPQDSNDEDPYYKEFMRVQLPGVDDTSRRHVRPATGG